MLSINYTYKNISERDKKFLQDYCLKKLDRFKVLMKRFREEECRLEVKAEAFATKAAYKVELIIHLPGNILMAKEDDHTIIEATDLAVDKLIIQLRKLISKNQ
ncbi:hypothetical protein A3B87_00390 [Candidatus Kuenenbacteria bacterium RIFCSPHIGHO2_02_FULL_39_13]|uniref:Ribosomal subunit interface protein n=1 Tax=Candidatus Kuenenbacteria bacterium RIFCSPHIGHO2_02_FULL_39_13 TaxID=1798561 RepID=A0A1F6FKU6_9BACT|nr:MAG: hypothetical protein A3B87_00390 [Candidatus Kuenenbacteria bacterium RIFCSPHIGHO2_02_FULL_39_13]